MGDDRPTVYQEQERVYYRASGSGDCVRALVASAMSYQERRSEDRVKLLSTSAEEGNLHESWVQDKFREQGFTVHGDQDTVEVQVIPGVFVRGHVDGLVDTPMGMEKVTYISGAPTEWNSKRALLEVKSMSNAQFKKWESGRFKNFEKYAYQISWYMEAFPECDVLYVVKRREDGRIMVNVIPAGQPPIPLKDRKKKILVAEKYRRKQEFPECDSKEQWFCPFWYLHDEEEDEGDYGRALSAAQEEELALMLVQYLKLKEVEDRGKEAEKTRKELNKSIKSMMEHRQGTVKVEFEGEEYTVRIQGGGGRSFNKNAFIGKYGQEEYDKYETEYRYEYPVVRKAD